jgi:hypothetical protein
MTPLPRSLTRRAFVAAAAAGMALPGVATAQSSQGVSPMSVRLRFGDQELRKFSAKMQPQWTLHRYCRWT